MTGFDRAKLLQAKELTSKLLEILKGASLGESISFEVVSDHTDPHRVVVVDVTVSRRGVRIAELMPNNPPPRYKRREVFYEWFDLIDWPAIQEELQDGRELLAELYQEIDEAESELRGHPATVRFEKPRPPFAGPSSPNRPRGA